MTENILFSRLFLVDMHAISICFGNLKIKVNKRLTNQFYVIMIDFISCAQEKRFQNKDSLLFSW